MSDKIVNMEQLASEIAKHRKQRDRTIRWIRAWAEDPHVDVDTALGPHTVKAASLPKIDQHTLSCLRARLLAPSVVGALAEAAIEEAEARFRLDIEPFVEPCRTLVDWYDSGCPPVAEEADEIARKRNRGEA